MALMAFVAICGAVGAWVPQGANVSPEAMASWEADNRVLVGITRALGLDHLFSTWWFLTALGVFALAMSIATVRMAAGAYRATDGPSVVPHAMVVGGSVDEVVERARAGGFRERRRTRAGLRVLVRHPLGLWGPTVLHAGMLVALLAALAASALTSQAILDLSQSEVRSPGDEYLVTESDVLGRVPELGRSVRFDDAKTETWPDGSLKSVTATLSISGDDDGWVAYTASPNDPLHLDGHTIYVLPGEFGDAAFLIVTAPDGAEYRIRTEFRFVPEGEAGYAQVAPAGVPVIDARWDPHGVRGPVALSLRPAGDDEAEPVTVAPGETVEVGEYSVALVGMAQWMGFRIVRPYAIGVLFFGFGIIGLGSLMLYLWVSRELVLEQTTDGVRYGWRAARMGRTYLAERDAILGVAPDAGDDR
jgi:cytochrome c biogenesis protein ResB